MITLTLVSTCKCCKFWSYIYRVGQYITYRWNSVSPLP